MKGCWQRTERYMKGLHYFHWNVVFFFVSVIEYEGKYGLILYKILYMSHYIVHLVPVVYEFVVRNTSCWYYGDARGVRLLMVYSYSQIQCDAF